MQPEPLFYIEREEGEKAGPYDLVQMAGLLRKKIITPETMTCLKGAEDWKAFSWQPQFSVVREMPPGAVSNRVTDLEEKAMEANAPPIPLPSAETVMKLGGLLLRRASWRARGLSYRMAGSNDRLLPDGGGRCGGDSRHLHDYSTAPR